MNLVFKQRNYDLFELVIVWQINYFELFYSCLFLIIVEVDVGVFVLFLYMQFVCLPDLYRTQKCMYYRT